MPAGFKVDISALDDIREIVNPKRIKKDLALSAGHITLGVINALESYAFSTYHIKGGQIKQVRNFKTSADTRLTGKRALLGEITYSYKARNLIEHLTEVGEWHGTGGFIYAKHYVTVKRGRKLLSRGKYKRGGFEPNYDAGFMAERISRKRYPFRIMMTLSYSQMVEAASNNPDVKARIDKVSSEYLDRVL